MGGGQDEFSLSFDLRQPNYPTVHVAVNGLTDLDGGSHTTGHNPELLLDNGALVPRDLPHRVALAGCSCGEFGCSTLTALIVADGDTVRWTDFAEGFDHFDEALPYGNLSDPLVGGPPTSVGEGLEFVFGEDQYMSTLVAAAADRSWETRPCAVARITRHNLGWDRNTRGNILAWRDEVDALAANVQELGKWSTYLLPIPSGTSQEAADQLTCMLRRQHPRELAGARRLTI